MNKQLVIIIITLIITSVIFSASAQEDQSKNKVNLGIGIGLNTFGPISKMNKLMIEQNFDIPTNRLLGSGTIEHPDFKNAGFSCKISYSRSYSQKSNVGIEVIYSSLREIVGYSNTAWYLFIRFSSIDIVPMYKYELSDHWELLLGPALMINTGKKTNIDYDEDAETFTKFSLGLLSGINLNIWDHSKTYGKINTNILFALPNKMGPYTAEGWPGNIASIPENKFGFGHLTIGFVFGFHL